MNFFKKLFTKEKKETLDSGLKKSKDSFFNKISKVIVGKSKVDDEVLDNLEEVLISSDVGVKTTLKIIDHIEDRVKKIVSDQLGSSVEEVNNDSSFVDDLGADSLDTVELVMALEEEFDLEIADEDAEKISTVNEAVDYINSNS